MAVHGDFSLDQVVVGREGARLIDLDHAHRGPAAQDLGSLLADLLSATGAGADRRAADGFATVMAGYTDRRTAPDRQQVTAWLAVHLLRRSAEPFRRCAPDWATDVRRQLDLTEAALSGAWT